MTDQASPALKSDWQTATITRIIPRTETIKSYFLALPHPSSIVLASMSTCA